MRQRMRSVGAVAVMEQNTAVIMLFLLHIKTDFINITSLSDTGSFSAHMLRCQHSEVNICY